MDVRLRRSRCDLRQYYSRPTVFSSTWKRVRRRFDLYFQWVRVAAYGSGIALRREKSQGGALWKLMPNTFTCSCFDARNLAIPYASILSDRNAVGNKVMALPSI